MKNMDFISINEFQDSNTIITFNFNKEFIY